MSTTSKTADKSNIKAAGSSHGTKRLVHVVGVATEQGLPSRAAKLKSLKKARLGGSTSVKRGVSNTVPVSGGEETAGSKMLGELMSTGAIGMWKDRKDIKDSSAFARQLRERSTPTRRQA